MEINQAKFRAGNHQSTGWPMIAGAVYDEEGKPHVLMGHKFTTRQRYPGEVQLEIIDPGAIENLWLTLLNPGQLNNLEGVKRIISEPKSAATIGRIFQARQRVITDMQAGGLEVASRRQGRKYFQPTAKFGETLQKAAFDSFFRNSQRPQSASVGIYPVPLEGAHL